MKSFFSNWGAETPVEIPSSNKSDPPSGNPYGNNKSKELYSYPSNPQKQDNQSREEKRSNAAPVIITSTTPTIRRQKEGTTLSTYPTTTLQILQQPQLVQVAHTILQSFHQPQQPQQVQ
jgi:hypothetical protein